MILFLVDDEADVKIIDHKFAMLNSTIPSPALQHLIITSKKGLQILTTSFFEIGPGGVQNPMHSSGTPSPLQHFSEGVARNRNKMQAFIVSY